jgi:hypothetical protein
MDFPIGLCLDFDPFHVCALRRGGGEVANDIIDILRRLAQID